MNCKKCGIRLNDSWESCPACGTAVKEEKLCAKCGYKLDDEWKSCPACGAEVEVKKELLCAKCGYKLKDDWKSCPACGAAIEKEIFCAKCGYKLNEDWSNCPSCGTAVKEEKNLCAHCGREVEKNWRVCPGCGFDVNRGTPEDEFKHSTDPDPINETYSREGFAASSAENNHFEEPVKPDYDYDYTRTVEPVQKPMKWYHFLKVTLWFGIVSNLISAIIYFSGSVYQGYAEDVYEALPSLRNLDIFSGVFALATVVITFIAWYGLQNYKASGPKTLTAMYIMNIAFTIIYMIAMAYIIGGADSTRIYSSYSYGYSYIDLSALAFQPANIISIISGIVFAIVNHIYFNNRSDMFVN